MDNGDDLPRRTLHFLGDSHLRAPRHAAEQGWFEPFATEFTLVGGATAVGLRHPTSQTQALQVYRDQLLPCRPDKLPIFQLGEVDCGFVIWVRAQRYGESVSQQLSASLEAYGGFLAEMMAAGYGDIIVTSAMLPTIRDGQLDGEVSHLRREVKASLAERTALTMEYNARLEDLCAELGANFVDFTPHLMDPACGVLAEAFRHPDKADHHLDPELGGRLWVRLVADVLSPLGARQT